jgi:hypothetical protein
MVWGMCRLLAAAVSTGGNTIVASATSSRQGGDTATAALVHVQCARLVQCVGCYRCHQLHLCLLASW